MADEEIVWYEPYGKGFALFGDSKPYTEEIKRSGGRFNYGLRRGGEISPGWIFTSKSEDKLIDLVDRINSGHVKATTPRRDVSGPSRRTMLSSPIVQDVPARERKLTPKIDYQTVSYKIERP